MHDGRAEKSLRDELFRLEGARTTETKTASDSACLFSYQVVVRTKEMFSKHHLLWPGNIYVRHTIE